MSEKTASELAEHITQVAASLSQLQSHFQSSLSTSSTNNDLLQTSKIAKPLDEVPKLASLISGHATKLGLIYKPPIALTTYKTCWSELDNFVKYNVMLISLFKQLKSEVSTLSEVFYYELGNDATSVIDSCLILVNELQKIIVQEAEREGEPGDDEDDVSGRLTSIGMVWESCDNITKTHKAGSSGVLRSKLKLTNKLVIDALDELREWLENPIAGGGFDYDDDDIFGLGDENPAAKSLQEKNKSGHEERADDEVVKYGEKWSNKIQLVKLLISLLDKSIPVSKYNNNFAKGLDTLNDNRLKINEYVDDLVACVVYDSDVEGATEASQLLTKEINQIVDIVRKLNNDDEKKCKWLDSWKAKYQE
jgi:effector-binding domain-containing protein